MNESKCAWCGSIESQKILKEIPTKYQEFKCKKCGKISYKLIDFKLTNLPPFDPTNREFFMLEPNF